ncbi:MAG: hypothetical protein RDV00_03590 [Clostridia bacterium]|nr:hypothetical protein [Clostridia bacterium]MDQ7791194.1 hypothetical protein [Clostridia bacterium]
MWNMITLAGLLVGLFIGHIIGWIMPFILFGDGNDLYFRLNTLGFQPAVVVIIVFCTIAGGIVGCILGWIAGKEIQRL